MKIEEILKKYSVFRSNMGVPIERKLLDRYWNIKNYSTKNINIGDIDNPMVEEKIEKAKGMMDSLKVLDFVKFVGISGSVASGFVKEGDDIDVFVVVKNDRAWIYRAVVLFRNVFNKKIRVGNGIVKDKLCLNFISEERGLEMESDIFNLNEILSLIPIFNPDYVDEIFFNNQWVFDEYMVSRKILKGNSKSQDDKRFPVLAVFNFIFFLPQLLYMVISNHSPDFERIWKNYKKGRLEFFPKDFKRDKLRQLEF